MIVILFMGIEFNTGSIKVSQPELATVRLPIISYF